MDKRNERRGGFYWKGEIPYISVTNVLKVIDKSALRYWFGQKVYRAIAKNPELTEREALAVPYQNAKGAAERGSTVHSVVEAFKNTGKVPLQGIPEKYQGYVKAFYSWVDDVKPEFLENERTVFNEQYKYAGTLDVLCKLNGKPVVVDIKTSKNAAVYDEAHMQISAYLKCVESEAVDGGYIVSLGEEGQYNMVKARDGFKAFLHALGLYEFINYEKLEDIGWRS